MASETQKIVRNIRRYSRQMVKGLGLKRFASAQNNQCFICNQPLDLKVKEGKQAVTIDHVFPASVSFRVAGNLLLCHSTCNGYKSDRMPTKSEVLMLENVNKILEYDSLNEGYRVSNAYQDILRTNKHEVQKCRETILQWTISEPI